MTLTYVFIVFLDTYINMVKYLQRVPLDVSIGTVYTKMSERLIQKYPR